jgi:hypothetical protein
MRSPHFSVRISSRSVRLLLPAAVASAGFGMGAPRLSAHTATPFPESIPDVDVVADEVVGFSQLEVDQKLAQMFSAYHIDSLVESPGYVMAGWYADNIFPKGPQLAEPVGDVRYRTGWLWPVNGEMYDVFEVDFRQPFDSGDVIEGTYRIAPGIPEKTAPLLHFFGDTREFVDEQREMYRQRMIDAAERVDFQLLSFPADDVDLEASAPATWEDFTRFEIGTFAEPYMGAYARYAREECETACGPSEEILLTWQRYPADDAPAGAFDYGLQGTVRPVEGEFGPGSVFLTSPDTRLVMYTADESYARIQVPTLPRETTRLGDRLVFVAKNDTDVWFHSVFANFTKPGNDLATRFASSLPYIAV